MNAPTGAMSMAVGEYISVSSQRDTEQADVDKEREEQTTEIGRARELDELTQIYIERGLDFDLARQVPSEFLSLSVLICINFSQQDLQIRSNLLCLAHCDLAKESSQFASSSRAPRCPCSALWTMGLLYCGGVRSLFCDSGLQVLPPRKASCKKSIMARFAGGSCAD